MLIAVALGIALSAALTPLVIVLLTNAGVVDRANARSSHVGSVPRGGGFGVLAAVALAAPIAFVSNDIGWGRPALGVGVGAIAIAGIGAADDLLGGVRASTRLIATALAALATAAWVSDIEPWLVLFGGTGILASTNIFNFMDGINGITGLNTAVAGFGLAYLANDTGHDDLATLALCMSGAALAFCAWNLGGRVFLGDVGSYGIGALMSAIAVALVAEGVSWIAPVGCFLPYACDTGFTLVRRGLNGLPLTQPHRMHAYQRLADIVGSHVVVSFAVAGITACSTALTIAATESHGLARHMMLWAAIALAGAYALAPSLLGGEPHASG